MKTSNRHFWRLFVVAVALMGALACSDTGCDCVAPLPGPVAESEKVYDAIQARLSPHAFGFIEGNLTEILASFLAGGLVFDVPAIHEEFDAWLFTISLDICENGCSLQAEIVDATLSRVEPNILRLDALMNLTGTLTMTGDVDCDVPIHIQNKPITADVLLEIGAADKLLSFNVSGVDISIADDDFSLDCSGLLGWIIEALKGTITTLMNDQIGGQLDSALVDMLAGMTCMGCEFYADGCPAGSNCDGDYCDDGNACLTNPLGLVGQVDLGALLADFSPGLDAKLDLFVAAGQFDQPPADPLVIDDGLEIRLIGGADTSHNLCVPAPDPNEIPSSDPPVRLPFAPDNTVPGSADTYMAAIGVSDVFMDWFMYKAYLSGMLCLVLDTDSTAGLLSSGTLAALLGSLNTLTGGQNSPVQLRFRPQHVPDLEIGAGTYTVDENGNRIFDSALINVFMPETGLDFYVLIDGRWMKIVTLTQDLTLMIGLDFLPDNRVLPVLDENSIVIENVVASDYELLAEDPEALENLVPTLIGLALPLLTDSLGVMDLPPIEGFVLDILAVQGDVQKVDSEFYEYLGLYANLGLVATPLPAPRRTSAELVGLHTPLRSLMSIYAPDGPAYSEALVRVGAGRGLPAEFSWRLDGGAWSIFQPGPLLHIRSPLLALEGEHSLQVRSRSIGDYHTLDRTGVVLALTVEPVDDKVSYEPALPARSLQRLGLQAAGAVQAVSQAEQEEPSRIGCATSEGSGLWLLGLALVGLLRRRRA